MSFYFQISLQNCRINNQGHQLAIKRCHTLTQQQRPELSMVTLTWHASKYKVFYKLYHKYILKTVAEISYPGTQS